MTDLTRPTHTEEFTIDAIPAPQVLNPDRVLRDDRADMTAEDHRSQALMLDAALHETADYAQQLWNDLAAMRQYLYDSLPAEPDGGAAAGGASPVGPDDEQGWGHWCDAFAEVTSVLCGPRGDSGYGRSSATVLAQFRRRAAASTSEPARPVREPDVTRRPDPAVDTAEKPASQSDAAEHVTQDAPRAPMDGKGSDAATVLAPLAYAALGALGATLTLRIRLRHQS